MGILDAIKKGFGLASELMNLVVVFFVFNIVIGLISLPLANPARAGNPGIVAVSIISSILFFLVFIFLQGGALGLVQDQIKTASASIAQFPSYGKKFYLRILGLLLLYILIAIGIVLLLGLVSAGILLLGDNIVTRSIVAALVTVVAIAAVTLLVYPIYSIVVDDLGAVMALRKGVVTAKANFGRTLGLFVTMLIISLLISLVIGFIVGLVTVPLPMNISQILIAIINAAVQSYIPIVMMGAFMGFYLSLKEEGEGSPAAGPGSMGSI
ncbi:MAG: hypothetical protein ABIA77_06780 [Candidatus Omnitrophota bacterium]